MRVATTQFQHQPNDLAYNFEVIESLTLQAASEQCELVIFPECCLTGYWHLRHLKRSELVELAKRVIDGNYLERCQTLAQRHRVSIGVGYLEIDTITGELFNSYSVVSTEGVLATHRKLHCFISEYMQSGTSFTTFVLPNGRRCGILICYDNNIIENVRATALQGVEVLLAPHQTGGCNSGSPFAMGVIDMSLWDNRHACPDEIEAEFRGDKGRGWLMRWLPSRAHDNGIFILFSNGVGKDDDEVRTGNAMLLDPYGRIINETWVAKDTLVIGDLDFSLREQSTGARWIRARRPKLYAPLIKINPSAESTRTVRFEHLADRDG